MVDPFGPTPASAGVDDMAVVQMEIECVMRLGGVMRMALEGLAPGNDFTFVFQDEPAFLDGRGGVDASTVHAGWTHLHPSFSPIFRFSSAAVFISFHDRPDRASFKVRWVYTKKRTQGQDEKSKTKNSLTGHRGSPILARQTSER